MLRRIVCAAVGLCVTAASVLAQGTWTPQEGIETLPRGSDTRQQAATLGWVFHPIADETQVIAFYGELESQDAIGANVKQMYFVRDSEGEWTSYGWDQGDTDSAIAWIQSVHGVKALDRDNEYAGYSPTEAPVDPAPMKGGIFIDDPNFDIFEQMDPEARGALVYWLVEAGYAASPKLAELLITEYEGGPEVLNELMNYLTNQAEYTLFPAKTTYAVTVALAWPCTCTTTTTTVNLPTPGPAVLDPGTVPNPRPTADGQCMWRYHRVVGNATTTSTGRYLLCPSCASTSPAIPIYEFTDVIGPCAGPVPVPQPGDPWIYE